MSDVVLTMGSYGPEVGNWQRLLLELGIQDTFGANVNVDEMYGRRTVSATKSFQTKYGLETTGEVDTPTRAKGVEEGFVPFIQAKNFTPVYPLKRVVNLIVVHTMEAPQRTGQALNVASWFAGTSAPEASAHYCIDKGATIQCVRDMDIAWHAPGANHDGIGIEHAGYAAQNQEQWNAEDAQAMLRRSAQLAARLIRRYGVPIVRLHADDLAVGSARGFCGHVDVTNGLNHGKGHVDPGPDFPWEDYLAMVKELAT